MLERRQARPYDPTQPQPEKPNVTTKRTTKARAILSDVTVSFGLLSFSVDVLPAHRSKSARSEDRVSAVSVCPACETAHKLTQRLHCPVSPSHGPFVAGEVDKALVGPDGELHKVDPDAVAAAKVADVETRTIALCVSPAEQVEAATMPSGSIYRLRLRKPTKATEQAYALVMELIANREVAFICEMTLKTATKLYRVITRDGMLTMTELVRPEEFHPAEPVTVPCDPRLVETGTVLVHQMLDAFDAEAWRDRSADRLAELRDQVAGFAPVTAAPSLAEQIEDTADQLLAKLQQSVSNAA
jgi:hypothetical protein